MSIKRQPRCQSCQSFNTKGLPCKRCEPVFVDLNIEWDEPKRIHRKSQEQEENIVTAIFIGEISKWLFTHHHAYGSPQEWRARFIERLTAEVKSLVKSINFK